VKDYLLAPVPAVGKKSICSNDAWMVGLCIADGTIGKCVAFTMDKNESHRHVLEKCLENRFYLKVAFKNFKDSMKKLKREVGGKVTILYTTSFGSFKGSTFEIVGKAQSPLPMINDSIFYLPLDQAQRILEMPDEVTELLIITADHNKTSLILLDII